MNTVNPNLNQQNPQAAHQAAQHNAQQAAGNNGAQDTGLFAQLAAKLGMTKRDPQQVQDGQMDKSGGNQQMKPQNQGNNNQPGGNGGGDGNGGNGNQQSPAEMFKDMFKVQSGSGNNEPFFQPDMKKFGEEVAKMDFVGKSDPEQIKLALSGDQNALNKLLNSVGQNAFSQSTQVNLNMQQTMGEKLMAKMEKDFETKYTRNTAQRSLHANNPAFKSPEMAPLIKTLTENMQSKFPEATPEDIQNNVQTYLSHMAQMITKPETEAAAADAAKKKQVQSGDQDFEEWANS